jgi:hypothetical protein
MADEPRPEPLGIRRTRAVPALWLLVVAAVLAVVAWYVTHPPPLPRSADTVQASSPVGEAVYVGVYAPTVDSRRTIRIRDLEVTTEGDLPVEVTGLVCEGGAINVTSDPTTFCTRLVDAEGATVSPGDVLVLELTSTLPGEVLVDRVRLSYRDGLQWATQEVGPQVEVTFLGG